jgi:hypothetical protein
VAAGGGTYTQLEVGEDGDHVEVGEVSTPPELEA